MDSDYPYNYIDSDVSLSIGTVFLEGWEVVWTASKMLLTLWKKMTEIYVQPGIMWSPAGYRAHSWTAESFEFKCLKM